MHCTHDSTFNAYYEYSTQGKAVAGWYHIYIRFSNEGSCFVVGKRKSSTLQLILDMFSDYNYGVKRVSTSCVLI